MTMLRRSFFRALTAVAAAPALSRIAARLPTIEAGTRVTSAGRFVTVSPGVADAVRLPGVETLSGTVPDAHLIRLSESVVPTQALHIPLLEQQEDKTPMTDTSLVVLPDGAAVRIRNLVGAAYASGTLTLYTLDHTGRVVSSWDNWGYNGEMAEEAMAVIRRASPRPLLLMVPHLLVDIRYVCGVTAAGPDVWAAVQWPGLGVVTMVRKCPDKEAAMAVVNAFAAEYSKMTTENPTWI